MNTVNIINHGGATRLLSKIAFKDGRGYPFAFDALTPEQKHWAYRMVPSDPTHLTDEQLIQLLQANRSLRADWEEQVGHPVGFLTLYLRNADGGADPRQARFERGPDLTPQIRAPEPVPTPPEPSFDMSF